MQPVKSITKLLAGGLIWGLAGLLSGCQTAPPVQEMSDARQAIAVARDAGAEQAAKAEIREAEALLDSARRNLHERLFVEARRDAVSAKRRALDALAVAEAIRPEPH